MFYRLILACALACPPMLAQGGGMGNQPAVERLDQSATSASGESLPLSAMAARLVMGIPAEFQELNTDSRPAPPVGPSDAAYSSYALGANPSRMADIERQLAKDVDSMRILAFMTQPGERITFSLKSEQSKVRLAVYTDPVNARTNSKITAAIKAANMPFNSMRAKKLVFTNSSKEPYEMLLMVYGKNGYGYSLDWARKPKK